MHACNKCSFGGYMDLYSIFVLVVAYLLLAAVALLSTSRIMREDARIWTPRNVSVIVSLLWIVNTGVSLDWKGIYREPLGSQGLKMLMLGIFGVLIACWCGVGLLSRKFHPNYAVIFFVLGGVTLVVAVLCWYPRKLKGECPDIEAVELHAMWHAFIALAFLWPYLHSGTVDEPRLEKFGFWSVVLLRDLKIARENISIKPMEI